MNEVCCEEGGGGRCVRKGKFELLAKTETKLKGKRGITVWSKWYHWRCSGDGKSKGRVAILFNDVWHSAVIDFRYVSSRIQMD